MYILLCTYKYIIIFTTINYYDIRLGHLYFIEKYFRIQNYTIHYSYKYFLLYHYIIKYSLSK